MRDRPANRRILYTLLGAAIPCVAVGCIVAERDGPSAGAEDRRVVRSTAFGAGGGDGALSGVFDVEVAPDGHVIISEPQFRRVSVHAPDGTFSHTIGGPGQGPGEFRYPADLAWRGDSLTVLDFSSGSILFFGLDGTYRDQVTFNVLAEGRSFPFRPMTALADGSVLAMSPSPMGQGTTEPWTRANRRGAVEDTLWIRDLEGRQVRIETGGRFVTTGLPLDHGEQGVLPPRGHVLVLGDPAPVSSGDAGVEPTYRLTRVDLFGDTLATVEVPYVPVPVTAGDIDSIAASRATGLIARGTPEGAAVDAWTDQISWPETWPAISRLRAGDDGSVWVRRERPEAGVVRWDVFDADLAPAGTVRLPESLDVKWVSDTAVYGVELDSLDVPTVVRYAVGR